MATKPKTIDEYIVSSPIKAREMLNELRKILKEASPDSKENIKWGSPVFEGKRILFAFSAFKSHLNFMPTHSSLEPFKKELTSFQTGKDTIQFPYDQPLPIALIKKIAKHRIKEVEEKDAKWMGQNK